MTEKSPPGFNQNYSSPGYGAQMLRELMQFLGGVGTPGGGNLSWPSFQTQPGCVLRPTSMKVTVSSGLTMSVAAGAALVGGSRSSDQGAYFCYNHGAKTVTLASAPVSNPRIDVIIAQVLDAEKIGSGSDVFQLVKVDGTPASSPSPPDLSSFNDVMVLAECHVTTGGVVTVVDVRRIKSIDGAPIGSITDMAVQNSSLYIPFGYLACDGQSLTTTQYPDLFEVIGYTYGGSSSNFNVPDLRGRVAVGIDSMLGSSAGDGGRLAAANTNGGVGGEELHTLTQAELPATVTLSTFDPPGSPTNRTHIGSGTNTGASASVALGSGTAMNNMPPYILLNKIIRAY